jgi:hypothetical protein
MTWVEDESVPTYGVSHEMSADDTNEPMDEPLVSTPNEQRGTRPSVSRMDSWRFSPVNQVTAPPSAGPRAGPTDDVAGVAVTLSTASLAYGPDVGKSRPAYVIITVTNPAGS